MDYLTFVVSIVVFSYRSKTLFSGGSPGPVVTLNLMVEGSIPSTGWAKS